MYRKLGFYSLLIFLGFFLTFYFQSKRFRKSLIAAFAAVQIFGASTFGAQAQGSADAFQTPVVPSRVLPEPGQGMFSSSSSSEAPDNGSGSESNDLTWPPSESVKTDQERLSRIESRRDQLDESSDSEEEEEKADTSKISESYKKTENLDTVTK